MDLAVIKFLALEHLKYLYRACKSSNPFIGGWRDSIMVGGIHSTCIEVYWIGNDGRILMWSVLYCYISESAE